ncbi:MAG: class I SAM-dependent methyltransferase [Actinomycetota bacterium]
MPGRSAGALDPKVANERYHDAAAASYDAKWSIAFDPPSQKYVRDRAERMLPSRRYERVLEVGAGTGFFLLNMWQTGFVEEPHATDISEGMLEVCRANAEMLGATVGTRAGDAERLPYEDDSFDLVIGHAFLHHIPDPLASLVEMRRVLRPGGAVFIAGEPTYWGDRLAGLVKRATRDSFRLASSLPRVGIRREKPPPSSEEEHVLHELEFDVDLHTFRPSDVERWAQEAGMDGVKIETEELIASMFGWAVRTLEAEARPDLLGKRWARFAYRTWRGLYRIDDLLRGVIPRSVFYNLLLYAEKPRS